MFDAYGDYDISWSYIEDDKLVDLGYFKMNDSLGNLMNGASIEMEIVVQSRLDSSGKFMGLQTKCGMQPRVYTYVNLSYFSP